MAFDPISWLIGFILTRLGVGALSSLFPADLKRDLNKVIIKWSDELPKEIYTPPKSLLDPWIFENEQDIPEELQELGATIRVGRIPSSNLWSDALKAIWTKKKRKLGSSANSFFQLEEKRAYSYLNELGKQLEKTCIENAKLFQVSVFEMLNDLQKEIKEGFSRVESRLDNEVDEDEFFSKSEKFDKSISSLFICKSSNSNSLGIAINNSGLILCIGRETKFERVENLETRDTFDIKEYFWSGPFIHVFRIEAESNGIVPEYAGLNFGQFFKGKEYYSFDKFGNKVQLQLTATSIDGLSVGDFVFSNILEFEISDKSEQKRLASPILTSNDELVGLSFANGLTRNFKEKDCQPVIYAFNWVDISKSLEIIYQKATEHNNCYE